MSLRPYQDLSYFEKCLFGWGNKITLSNRRLLLFLSIRYRLRFRKANKHYSYDSCVPLSTYAFSTSILLSRSCSLQDSFR